MTGASLHSNWQEWQEHLLCSASYDACQCFSAWSPMLAQCFVATATSAHASSLRQLLLHQEQTLLRHMRACQAALCHTDSGDPDAHSTCVLYVLQIAIVSSATSAWGQVSIGRPCHHDCNFSRLMYSRSGCYTHVCIVHGVSGFDKRVSVTSLPLSGKQRLRGHET